MGFEIGKLFDIKNGMKYPSDMREGGNLPLVSTSALNNGVSDYIKYRDDSTYKNILTVAYSGSVGATFYHKNEVFVGETVFALIPKYSSNIYNGMFISFILNYHNKRYSYGRKIIGSKYGKDVIKLPICYEDDGETPVIDTTHKYSKEGYIPDFKFMEEYIKSLPYGDRL